MNRRLTGLATAAGLVLAGLLPAAPAGAAPASGGWKLLGGRRVGDIDGSRHRRDRALERKELVADQRMTFSEWDR